MSAETILIRANRAQLLLAGGVVLVCCFCNKEEWHRFPARDPFFGRYVELVGYRCGFISRHVVAKLVDSL